MNSIQVPEKISSIWVGFEWDTNKIWNLKLPVEPMDLGKLIWHLDFPLWNKGNKLYQITPNAVLKNPEKYREHFIKIMKADSLYPIDIIWWRERWIILDGVHRLAKGKYFGYMEVDVRKIPHRAIPLIKK